MTFLALTFCINIFFIFLVTIGHLHATWVPMNVVEEVYTPSAYENQRSDETNLKIHMKPSKFHGPSHLLYLSHKCFEAIIERYHYRFCPFNNITQFSNEESAYSYHGSLGVWKEWNIQENIFESMFYDYGTPCDSVNRTSMVYLKCGANEKILNVTEPERCKYIVTFETPTLCRRDAMVVYPRLSPELQKKWDELKSELEFGILTEKGYNSGVTDILIEAGLKNKRKSESSNHEIPPCHNLKECCNAYSSLQKEYALLLQRLGSSSTQEHNYT